MTYYFHTRFTRRLFDQNETHTLHKSTHRRQVRCIHNVICTGLFKHKFPNYQPNVYRDRITVRFRVKYMKLCYERGNYVVCI